MELRQLKQEVRIDLRFQCPQLGLAQRQLQHDFLFSRIAARDRQHRVEQQPD